MPTSNKDVSNPRRSEFKVWKYVSKVLKYGFDSHNLLEVLDNNIRP